MAALLLLALGGCYARRRIILPPTATAQSCLAYCVESVRDCWGSQLKGHECQRYYDNCLLTCPGAREVSYAEWVDAGYEEPTPYQM